MNIANPIDVQFGIVHDCIRACVYADHIGRLREKQDAWWSIGDMCYADAVISWNHIFGTNSQKSHWKGFAELVPIPDGSKLKPFCKEMIADFLKIQVEEWCGYHKAMVEARNDLLAHFDHKTAVRKLPNITWAMHSAYLYRSWLIGLLKEYQQRGQNIKITSETGPEVLDMFRKQIADVCPQLD